MGYDESERGWFTEARAPGLFSEAGRPWGQATSSLILRHLLRIPLIKGKSLRRALKEHGLLDDFLKTHRYSPGRKYSRFGEVASEPLFNYLDVSGSARLPVTVLRQGAMGTPAPPAP